MAPSDVTSIPATDGRLTSPAKGEGQLFEQAGSEQRLLIALAPKSLLSVQLKLFCEYEDNQEGVGTPNDFGAASLEQSLGSDLCERCKRFSESSTILQNTISALSRSQAATWQAAIVQDVIIVEATDSTLTYCRWND